MHALEALDHIRLNFSPQGLHVLNIALSFIMFGVALEIKPAHFKKLLLNPKSAIVGVLSQFVVLPLVTFILTVSNFISSLAKGNVALSVSLTAIATMAAVFNVPCISTLCRCFRPLLSF